MVNRRAQTSPPLDDRRGEGCTGQQKRHLEATTATARSSLNPREVKQKSQYILSNHSRTRDNRVRNVRSRLGLFALRLDTDPASPRSTEEGALVFL